MSIPHICLPLVFNTITQFVRVAGVNGPTTKVSTLTDTLVFVIVKQLSYRPCGACLD